MPKRTSSPPPAAAKGDKNGAEKAADRWRETVFLPRTDFPMRGGLPEKEPKILAFWNEIDLFRLQREQSRGRPKYILHDGPPYANGELHIGTALNKILKDIINRSRQALGADANYVPGWDCHGLPIEWKVEEEIRAAGRSKEDIPPVEFRRLCRAFAEKWIHIQREGFRRYGVIGDWDDPYLTMTGAAEGQIVRELGKFIRDGGLYRAARPVLWSVPEATALADAEVEYREHVSPSVWVGYRAMSGALAEAGAEVVIWTTTPWTIPGSSAVAFLADAEYVLINDGARHFVVAASCAESFIAARVKKGDNKGAGNGDNEGAEKSGGVMVTMTGTMKAPKISALLKVSVTVTVTITAALLMVTMTAAKKAAGVMVAMTVTVTMAAAKTLRLSDRSRARNSPAPFSRTRSDNTATRATSPFSPPIS